MRQISYHHVRQPGLRLVGLLTLPWMLIIGLGLMPLGSAALHAGEQPQKGGIVLWAVHESMPTFDTHFDTSYILAQPVAPLLDTAAITDRQKKSDFQAYTAPAAVHMDDPDLYDARFTCDALSNDGKYCNPEFDKLFKEQSRVFDVQKRAEITRKMERLLLDNHPDDGGYYWKSSMDYWNRVKNWPPLPGTTVYNYGKFEQVWCQSGRCM